MGVKREKTEAASVENMTFLSRSINEGNACYFAVKLPESRFEAFIDRR